MNFPCGHNPVLIEPECPQCLREALAKTSRELHMMNQLSAAQRMRIERLEAALNFYTWSDFEEADKGKIARVALNRE